MARSENATQWDSIVSETQFATHQTCEGASALALVTNPDQLLSRDASSVRYHLHNGLLSFTTGLERLAKLTLSANHFRVKGQYPRISVYGHALSKLLDEVEKIDLAGITNVDVMSRGYIARGRPSTPASLVPLLEKYAKGGGRYEYLDSLSGGGTEPQLYKDWTDLANAYSVPAWLPPHLSLHHARLEAIRRISYAAETSGLEGAEILLQPFVEQLAVNLHEKSIAIALDCYRLARWVADYLTVISHELFYPPSPLPTYPIFPYLPEILGPELLHTAENFTIFSILKLEDIAVTEEALVQIYESTEDIDDYDETEE